MLENVYLFGSGLDSKAARQCLEILQRLATDGRTVICTIHQPSSLLLNMFNSIYVLSKGYCIYQGTVDNLLPFMRLNDFVCPIYYNPVEYGKIPTFVNQQLRVPTYWSILSRN